MNARFILPSIANPAYPDELHARYSRGPERALFLRPSAVKWRHTVIKLLIRPRRGPTPVEFIAQSLQNCFLYVIFKPWADLEPAVLSVQAEQEN